jgi:hypothetical protein
MCSCLQLPQRGLPCRHYFAVLLNHPGILFNIDVVHPRWLTVEVKQQAPSTSAPLAAAAAAAAATLAPEGTSHPLFKLTMPALKAQLEAKGAGVRGLKHKVDLVNAIIAYDRAAGPEGAEGDSSTTAAPSPAISSETTAAAPPPSSEAIAAPPTGSEAIAAAPPQAASTTWSTIPR